MDLGLAAEVAVVDGFGDADPDVEEAETGDEAADGTVVEDGAEGGAGLDEGVVIPDAAPPGKDHDENAEVDAEEDEDEQRKALQPDRGAGRGSAGGRRSGGDVGRGGAVAVREVQLLCQHQALSL